MEINIIKKFALITFYLAGVCLSADLALATPPLPNLQFYDQLEANGNYYWVDEEGRSFLQISINLGLIERAYRLIEHDALNHLDERRSIAAVLESAIGQDDIGLIKKIIAVAKEHGVSDQLSMNSGLWFAVVFGKKDYVEFFLNEGASFSALAEKNPDLIAVAVVEKQAAMVKLLRENGFPLTSPSFQGKLLLNLAVYDNNKEITNYLLEQGADFTLRDDDDFTALGWALGLAEADDNTDFEIIDMLIEAGANPCEAQLNTYYSHDGKRSRVTLQQLFAVSENQALLEKLRSHNCQF